MLSLSSCTGLHRPKSNPSLDEIESAWMVSWVGSPTSQIWPKETPLAPSGLLDCLLRVGEMDKIFEPMDPSI